jgi:DNA-binding NarL/FixJ family response regulator
VTVMVGKKLGRFTLKDERALISMATNGATLSEIAAKFGRSVKTIERKARELSVSIKRRPNK